MKKVTKMTKQVKGFVAENKGLIVMGTMLFGAYALGYANGAKIEELKLENGLQKVINVKPELENIIKEGIEEVKKKG